MTTILRIARKTGLAIFWTINVVLGLIATCSTDDVPMTRPLLAAGIIGLEVLVYHLYKNRKRRPQRSYLGKALS